jgi:hypothetical protein
VQEPPGLVSLVQFYERHSNIAVFIRELNAQKVDSDNLEESRNMTCRLSLSTLHNSLK